MAAVTKAVVVKDSVTVVGCKVDGPLVEKILTDVYTVPSDVVVALEVGGTSLVTVDNGAWVVVPTSVVNTSGWLVMAIVDVIPVSSELRVDRALVIRLVVRKGGVVGLSVTVDVWTVETDGDVERVATGVSGLKGTRVEAVVVITVV